jgi:hypothetical protein
VAVTNAGQPKAFQLDSTTYRPSDLTSSGSVIGTVELAPLPAADDSMPACDTGTPTPPRSHAALVWISGLASGKAMPMEKRSDLASEDCGLDPSIVAATVGSTINVYNDDAALHRLVFRNRSHDTLVAMPFFNTGQVVASERLAKTVGLIDVSCARHPWTHATIAVFDQPYFAVTDEHGRFSMDSVPPGSYTLMVWRPDLAKPIARALQVSAERTTDLTIGGPGDGQTSRAGQTELAAKPNGAKRSKTIAAKRRAK